MTPIRILAAAPLLLCAFVASAEKREFLYSVDTEVDAGGVVASADVIADIDPAFEASLVGLMKSWRFKAAKRDGIAVAARTSMWIKVVATINDDQTARVSARYVSHGTKARRQKPPSYPRDLLRRGGEAEVVLDVTFDANGMVSNIAPFQIRVTGGSKEMAKSFHAAAHNAVASWKVRPEVVGGVPVASRMLIPIKFTLHGSTGGRLRTTLDRSTEMDDLALKDAGNRLDPADPNGIAIGNSTGLELISDAASG